MCVHKHACIHTYLLHAQTSHVKRHNLDLYVYTYLYDQLRPADIHMYLHAQFSWLQIHNTL